MNGNTANNRPLDETSYPMRRIHFGLIITLIGFLFYVLGVRPDVFRLDRSPVIGFVQIAVFLVGLAIICIGGYLALAALWERGTHSILADIGLRLVSTGYLVCVFAGMADVFGFGSHPLPAVPYFGPLQTGGVLAGQAVVCVGFLLLIPYQRNQSPHRPGK